MFISKKDLRDLKSKAGATSMLQSQIAKLTNELNAHKGLTGQQVVALKKELDFEGQGLDFYYRSFKALLGYDTQALPKRTLKTVIKEITNRLDQQEKMQKMLFDHLGIEYAKITEETKDGRQEKDVLRKIKTIKK